MMILNMKYSSTTKPRSWIYECYLKEDVLKVNFHRSSHSSQKILSFYSVHDSWHAYLGVMIPENADIRSKNVGRKFSER